jgi:AbrB family looped-hinge helix DNA binding protein
MSYALMRRIANVGKQGHVTIPAEIRSKLGITQGARVCVTLEDVCVVSEIVSEALIDRTRGMRSFALRSFEAAAARDIQRDSKT